MALNYTYLKYKDTHTLKNTGSVTLTYSVSKVTCEATTEIKTGTLIAGQSASLSFPVDGEYSVYLASTVETGVPFIIKHYNHLLTSFITMVEGIVCGCSKCNDCEECNQCEDYLGALLKGHAFNTLNYPLYQDYLDQVTENSVCVYSEQVLCGLLHEKVYGNVEVKEAMLRLISFYYLAFYYKDLFLAVDVEEKDYTTAKYKFDKIAACMRKLGIMPESPMPPCILEGFAAELAPASTTTSTTSTTSTTLPPTSSTTTSSTTSSTTTTEPPTSTTSTSSTTSTTSTTTEPTSTTSTSTSTSTTTEPSTTTTTEPTTTTSTTTTTTTTTTTEPPIPCLEYVLYGPGTSGEETTAEYIDCAGNPATATAYDYMNVTFCAQSIISGNASPTSNICAV